MRIGLVGYGRMGKLIRQVALERGHQVPVVIDPAVDLPEVTGENIAADILPLDVIIDFSRPELIVSNINKYAGLRLPVVIGTTGWYDQIDEVKQIVEDNSIGLIWSGNFSLGANLLFALVKTAGTLFNSFPQYDVAIHETHHRLKEDCPSGTAKMIGGLLLSALDRKHKVGDCAGSGPVEESMLQISAARCGSIPGTHSIIFDSDVDTITLEHRARNRSGFAEGALSAAEWISNRVGFYSIDDFIKSIIRGET